MGDAAVFADPDGGPRARQCGGGGKLTAPSLRFMPQVIAGDSPPAYAGHEWTGTWRNAQKGSPKGTIAPCAVCC
jgi:hypothetical protein